MIYRFAHRNRLALERHGRQRTVPCPSQEDEYLVVLKTSTKPSPKKGVGDYHFVIRLSNGTWADKPGPSPSRWNAVDGFADAWPLGEDMYYYNGGTAYFAVRRKE